MTLVSTPGKFFFFFLYMHTLNMKDEPQKRFEPTPGRGATNAPEECHKIEEEKKKLKYS